MSDGTRAGTTVWLVVQDSDGHELRYRVPNVVHVHYGLRARHGVGVLNLGIGGAGVVVKVPVGPGKSTVEDIMADIAAARLRDVDR